MRQRRLNAVPAEELPLGADAIEMVAAGDRDEADDAADEAAPAETTLDLDLRGAEPAPAETDADADTGDAPPEQANEEPADSPGRKSARRRGRASVPSWDEIMFGGGKGD